MDAHGHLLVLDFGVSALTEVIPDHHAYTLSYAAPDQISKGQLPNPSFDTFAITSLLVKCLSNQSDNETAWQAKAIDKLKVNNDLKMILSKGIAEQSNQRYQHAKDLAMDLNLWLNQLPIIHFKNNPFYLFKKAISRHPTSFSLGLLALISMLVGLVFYQQQYQVALSQSIKAQQVKEILIEAIDQNDPDVSKGNELTVRDMLKKVELSHFENPTNDKQTEKELFLTLAQAFNKLGDYESTENNIRKVLRLEPINIEALLELAELKVQQKEVKTVRETMLQINQTSIKLSIQNTIRKYLIQANLAIIDSEFNIAESEFSKAQNLAEETNDVSIKIKVLAAHANGLYEQHEIKLAIKKTQEAVQISESKLGEMHSLTLNLKIKLAEIYLSSTGEDIQLAVELFEKIIPQQKILFGKNHPNVAKSLFLKSTALRVLNQLAPAKENAQQALLIAEQQLGKKHIFTGRVLMSIGVIYLDEQNIKKAIEYSKMAMDNYQEHFGSEHPETLQFKTSYVALLTRDEQYEKALKLLLQIHPVQTAKLGPNHRGTLYVDIVLSKTYVALDNLNEGVLVGERCLNNAQKSKTKNIMEVFCAVTLENAYYLNKQYEKSISLIKQYQSDPLINSRPDFAKQFKNHKTFMQSM